MTTEAKNKGQMYKEAESYVNDVCGAFLEPHSEFVSIECRHRGTEEAFIRIVDSADTVRFYNITGISLEEVCEMVVKVVMGEHTTREISGRDKRKEVARLFR